MKLYQRKDGIKILLILLLNLFIYEGVFSDQKVRETIATSKNKRKIILDLGLEYPLKGIDKEGIGIEVRELSEDAIKLGLNIDRIRTFTELRLRREGIKINTESPFDLYIEVKIVETAFSINLKIYEYVFLVRDYFEIFKDETLPITAFLATTWISGSLGVHGKDTEFILTSLGGLIDEFLNNYYKANPKKKEVNHGNL